MALLTSIQFFNILDFVILLPLGPSLMRYFEISPAEFSILASSYSISATFSGLLYSSIADKFNRKSFLMFLLSFFIFSTLLCAVAPNYHMLLLARVTAGLFAGIITPVVYAIISDLIPYARRGKAVGTIMSSFSLASILGVPTGLAIADEFGWRSTFYFICIGSIIVSILNLFVLPSVPVQKITLGFKKNMSRLVHIAVKKEFRVPYLTMFLFTSSGFLLFPFLSPYAVKNIGIAETDLKYIYLVGGMFTVFSSRLAGILTDTWGGLKTFIPAVLFSIPFIYLYTSVEHLNLYTLLIISTGFMVFINFRFVPVMTLITATPSNEHRGSFMGILLSIRSLASASATMFSGYIITLKADGSLEHFHELGILSIGLTLIGALCYIGLYFNTRKDSYELSST